MTIHFTDVCDEKNKQKSNVCDVQMTKLNVKVQNLRYNDGGDRFSKTEMKPQLQALTPVCARFCCGSEQADHMTAGPHTQICQGAPSCLTIVIHPDG